MNIFIDCEFNGWGGDLISMALVPEEGEPFYEVVVFEGKGEPWVVNNVFPILNKDPITKREFSRALKDFLNREEHKEGIHIIADFPADISYFVEALMVGPGMSISTPKITMEIDYGIICNSSLPHNALADAKAIRESYNARKSNHS